VKVVGLFAGVGGLELGMSRAGHDTQLLCEIDPLARHVLERQFPDAAITLDVTQLERLPAGVEVVTAGFPCQDLSQAGRTAGIDGCNSGLVQFVLRLLAQSKIRRRPIPWLILENVPNMLRLDRGAAMLSIVDALETLGYRWAYRVVDSRAFGLRQRRLRVYLVASRVGDPRDVLLTDEELRVADESFIASAHEYGFYWTEGNRGLGWTRDAVPTLKGGSGVGIASPPALWRVRSHAFVVPTIEEGEELQGFPRGWTAIEGSPDRFRWRLVGNAVSVPVAEWLGRRLAEPGKYDLGRDLRIDGARSWPTAAYGGPRLPRRGVAINAWPEAQTPLPRGRLKGTPLSYRAAAGFFSRLTRSKLRRPPEFDDALDEYIASCAPRATGLSRREAR
jgi:DNA (cytosine-5)-methyltransferase 1